jgi:hypothetical protein
MKLYPHPQKRRVLRYTSAYTHSNRKGKTKMIILTDEIAMTANRRQYTIGNPCKGGLNDKQYFTRLENALQEAVRIAVRLEIADGSITELRQIVTEQARLEQEFSEKLKGVYV